MELKMKKLFEVRIQHLQKNKENDTQLFHFREIKHNDM